MPGFSEIFIYYDQTTDAATSIAHPRPQGWTAYCVVDHVATKTGFQKVDLIKGPTRARASARALVDKHMRSLSTGGQVGAYKVRFTLRDAAGKAMITK